MAGADPEAEHGEQRQSDVVLAAAGDRGAFERLYRSNVSRVFSLCSRMSGDRERAEELTQDVFVRAWEKLSQFRGDSAFSTWLHRLAVNVILNSLKTERKRESRADAGGVEPDMLSGHASEPGISLDLENAIASLPPGARTVFILHDVEGYRHEDIADLLGVTTGGSKAQLHRARMLLRARLSA